MDYAAYIVVARLARWLNENPEPVEWGPYWVAWFYIDTSYRELLAELSPFYRDCLEKLPITRAAEAERSAAE